MAKAKKKTTSVSARRTAARTSRGNMGLAIVALVLNILIPGVGSLVAGKSKEGIWQLVIVAIAIMASLLLNSLIAGFPFVVIALIWGIVTGVRLVKESQ